MTPGDQSDIDGKAATRGRRVSWIAVLGAPLAAAVSLAGVPATLALVFVAQLDLLYSALGLPVVIAPWLVYGVIVRVTEPADPSDD